MRAKLYAWLYPLAKIYWSFFDPNAHGAVAILEHQGRLLLIRNTYGEKYWNFPGGRIKRGESADATARREVKEEVGLAVGELKELGEIYAGPAEAKRSIVHCYHARVNDPQLVLDSGEILEARWFKPQEIPQFTSLAVPKIMRLISRQKIIA